jgi:hypothetical protein
MKKPTSAALLTILVVSSSAYQYCDPGYETYGEGCEGE